MKSKVLFLCTGNYYRSRFAEYLFNREAERHGLNWQADSCGLALEVGAGNVGPVSTHARARLHRHGIELGDDVRFPRQVQESDLSSSALIIALDRKEHQPMVAQRIPAWADKIEYWDVEDVGFVPADQALGQIELQVAKLVERLSQ